MARNSRVLVLWKRELAFGHAPRRRYVPIDLDHAAVLKSPLAGAVYYDVLYGDVYRRKGTRVRYSLALPEGWLIAVAAVMWEGIIQGATWDVVKLAVERVLRRLRVRGAAPAAAAPRAKRERVRFRYTEYSRSGRKKHEMFLELQRKYEASSEAQRRAIGSDFSEPR